MILLKCGKLLLTQGCDYFTDQKGALMIGQPDCLLDIIESFHNLHNSLL